MLKRFISLLVCFAFIFSNLQYIHAQDFSINQLPVPGSMINTTPAYVPLTLKGLIVHPENALKFDFLMDTGHSHLKGEGLKGEALKIMKYFLTALTIPEDDLWVNLSPYEKGRIIQDNFGQTIMGTDLLAQDYILKQLTASLIYPEKALGKEFWQQVYSKAAQAYGTTQIPVNTFNKVWIVPSEAVVWEHEGKVLIVKSHLKVMLEEDYLSLSKSMSKGPIISTSKKFVSLRKTSEASDVAIFNRTNNSDTHTLASQIVRTIVLPVLETEVNEGKNFAQLRQMYQSMILATWYKKALRESILNKVYANQKKTKGVEDINKGNVEAIYHQYLKAFKKGAFNLIKEDIDSSTGQTIPRKYFSGGMGEGGLDHAEVTLKGYKALFTPEAKNEIKLAETSTGNMISVGGIFNPAMLSGSLSSTLQSGWDLAKTKLEILNSTDFPYMIQKWGFPLLIGAGVFVAVGTVGIYLNSKFFSPDWRKSEKLAKQHFRNLQVPDIFSELRNPENPDFVYTAGVDVLDELVHLGLYGSIIPQYIEFINSYGWQINAPQWALDALTKYIPKNMDGTFKNTDATEALEDYKFRIEVRGLLRDPKNNLEKIIFGLTGERMRFRDILKSGINILLTPEERLMILMRALKIHGLNTWATSEIYKKSDPYVLPRFFEENDLQPASALLFHRNPDRGVNEAMLTAAKSLGGISLNAKLFDLQIKRDGKGVPLPLSQQPLDKINILGFVPQIISIQSVNLSALFKD